MRDTWPSQCDPPESEKIAGLEPGREAADHGRTNRRRIAAAGEDHACLLRRVAHQRLQELRKKHSGTEQDDAKHEHHHDCSLRS